MRGLAILLFLFLRSALWSQINPQCIKTNNTVIANLHFDDNSDDFKDAAIVAAGAFEELEHINLDIRRKSIASMMAARPTIGSFFTKRANRQYVIYISDKESMNANALFNEMSFCAQVGVLGHELSHIVSYEEMTNLQLMWFGIKYAFNKKEIEAETDLMAIKKGFGKHIIEFNNHIYHSSNTNKKYLSKKKKYYLSSVEIEQKIQQNL